MDVNMSNEVSKKEYLKRYLEKKSESGRKKKKKPKTVGPSAKVPSLKIINGDIDLKAINFGAKADEDEGDEAPVVAEVIDERPLEVQLKELYNSARWKKIDNNESSEPDLASKNSTQSERSSRQRHDSDSDFSPVRKQKRQSDSDISPPRRGNQNKSRYDSDSDVSPPRTHKKTENKQRTKKEIECRHDSDSDISPPRTNKQNINKRKHHDSDSDISPPRTNKQNINKKKHHDSDSDISPPRTNKQNINKKKHCGSDSDISPPRHQDVHKRNDLVKKSSKRHDSDKDNMSLRRKSTSIQRNKNRMDQDSDSDLSPPRSLSELSNNSKSKKLDKTLSGLKAGLQNARSMQEEVQEMKNRERKLLNKLEDDISGRNASTIIRDRKTGKKRDLNQEQDAKIEENKKAEEYQKKYDKWGKGIEQSQDKMEKFKDDLYEMSKPLARYKDDEDLDERLKSIIHAEDPMSEYIRKKKQKDTPNYPVYSGPPAPLNRFGILPGYRWDGVDRSNGFEKKYFEKINSSKAVQDEAYLWSVQDM